MSRAKRYNKGKLRYELVPTYALRKVVEVYTRGAHKYSVYEDKDGNRIKGEDIPFEDLPNLDLKMIEDGADNWRLGQDWLGSMASVKRHISDWDLGIDLDPDPAMKTLHLANAAWGLLSLIEYYKIFPQGDNRKHAYLNTQKIGLDIDEVLCDWVNPWCEKYDITLPNAWNFSYRNRSRFQELSESGELDDFYLNLPRLISPNDIPFEPHCYITSRGVPTEITMKWLENNGFPTAPVHTVGFGESKVEVARNSGIDIFIDDRYENFVELNKAGICTFLWDAPHNQRYDVGAKRLFNFEMFK